MKTMICLENTAYCPCSYEMIKEINNFVLNNNDEISLVSLDQTAYFTEISTAVFAPSELDSFNDGVIICNTINNAETILRCTNRSKKVLYLYDLDWMFEKFSYDKLFEILNNDNLNIILRSEDYIKPLRNLCGKKHTKVLESFKLEAIWNLL